MHIKKNYASKLWAYSARLPPTVLHCKPVAGAELLTILPYLLGVARFAEKNLTERFSIHCSARARTAVQRKSDNASVIWFVINNT